MVPYSEFKHTEADSAEAFYHRDSIAPATVRLRKPKIQHCKLWWSTFKTFNPGDIVIGIMNSPSEQNHAEEEHNSDPTMAEDSQPEASRWSTSVSHPVLT
jgi:hypothetical protein